MDLFLQGLDCLRVRLTAQDFHITATDTGCHVVLNTAKILDAVTHEVVMAANHLALTTTEHTGTHAPQDTAAAEHHGHRVEVTLQSP